MIKAATVAVLTIIAALAAPLADKFPTGQSTPEGAACDLARAFINRDAKLLRRVTIPAHEGHAQEKDYKALINSIAASMAAEAKKRTPSPLGPKTITECYASRHLTANGPASYAFAVLDFRDVKFVDVKVRLVNGRTAMNRTLVIKAANGKWYVHPAPAMSPMLSTGLNEETDSTVKFKSKGGR